MPGRRLPANVEVVQSMCAAYGEGDVEAVMKSPARSLPVRRYVYLSTAR
jgi:hypothetical protein